MRAAKAWSIWEGSTSKLYPDPDYISHFSEDEFSLAFARIECVSHGVNRLYPTLTIAS